ncbi:substrate-binding periplasmic protein [Burkholderia sp. WAC0059]|uniref:substrate-binding periplasmic protein n=1 Tax=Burkholderia sp. WAC0059 TaxID=2066022 RepID=UPI0015E1302A|nr:transporter substrate-binding domain-containing protein [Burkholderia sp. WAC0059]
MARRNRFKGWLAAAASLVLATAALLAPAGEAVAQTPAQEQGDMARILQTKVVRIGAIEAFPYYRHDLKTDKWIGIMPELFELMFGAIGVKVEYVTTDWGTAAAGLQSGKFDLVGGYNVTPQRALAVDFTDPLAASRIGLLTLKTPGPEYASWATLDRPAFRVAAVDGAATTRAAQKVLPHATWTLVQTNDAMLMELESGRVDAILSNEPTLSLYMQSRGQGHLVIPKNAIASPVSIALRRGNPDLRQWLDYAIQYYQADGSLKAIWNKYLPGSQP